MKEMDFLPASFHEALRRRVRTRRYVRFSLVLVAACGMLHLAGASKLRAVEAALGAMQAGEGNLLCQQARLANLKGRRQILARQTGLVSQLDDDAPLDAIVGELTRLMTESMALRSVEVETNPPAAAAVEKSDPVFSRGRTEVVLLAVAASDVEVGVFYGRLTACPLFEDARLSFSREVQQTGRRMREFEVKLAVKRVALRPVNERR